jgi:hypothetical protein
VLSDNNYYTILNGVSRVLSSKLYKGNLLQSKIMLLNDEALEIR